MASKGGKQAKKQAKGVSPISGTAPPVETRFQKGKSGNPHGRPKDLKQLRSLVQSSGYEIVDAATGMTRIEMMVRGMYTSRNPADRKEILRYGWGEPPTEQRNLNIDWSSLTDEQIERIGNGEDVIAVLAATRASEVRAGEAEATETKPE